MRLLADENVPYPSVRLLREAGYEVESMSEIAPGAPDTEVLRRAQTGRQVLITFDRDFGELVYHRGAPAPRAIVYLRFEPSDLEEPARFLITLLRVTRLNGSGASPLRIGNVYASDRCSPSRELAAVRL
jgi:predicted nuclease of predicted toxin-antitoxin system